MSLIEPLPVKLLRLAKTHWRKIAIGVFLLLFVIFAVVAFRSCGKAPKLDEAEIQKAQQAIAKEDRKVMVEILANSAVREQGIDNSIKAAEEAANKAKQDYSQLSNEELAAELERRFKGE